MNPFLRHGGRLSAARAAFPNAPEPWLDLSTGINPVPWEGPRASAAALRRLPDPADTAALEAAAARAFGADAASVVATPGAEAALRLMPRLTSARTVHLPTPTYGGHLETWASVKRAASTEAEAVVVVNPNNPDGRVTPPAELQALAHDRWVVVDESFVEVAPDLSLAAKAGGRLVVLRSFGKFYGLPGVRLGFVVAAPEVCAQVRAAFGDWPVGAEALAAGEAYCDQAWAEAARERLNEDCAWLDAALTAAGFEILGGTALFRLAASPDATRRFEGLAARGVLVRPFADHPDWLRFGLPAAHDRARLTAALEAAA